MANIQVCPCLFGPVFWRVETDNHVGESSLRLDKFKTIISALGQEFEDFRFAIITPYTILPSFPFNAEFFSRSMYTFTS